MNTATIVAIVWRLVAIAAVVGIIIGRIRNLWGRGAQGAGRGGRDAEGGGREADGNKKGTG